MEVGIIGAGRLGQAMARTALRAGRSVVIANSRGPESLASVVSALGEGVSAGTVADAAAADIVVIAVPWGRVSEAVEGLEWNGRTVIDATNDFDDRDLNGRTSSELVADLVPGACGREGREHARGRRARLGSTGVRGPARTLPLRRRRPSRRRRWPSCSWTPASPSSTSVTWTRAARCNRSAARSPAST